jgi:hypothetical protein
LLGGVAEPLLFGRIVGSGSRHFFVGRLCSRRPS